MSLSISLPAGAPANQNAMAKSASNPSVNDEALKHLVNPCTGEVDPQWYLTRLNYRRPLRFRLSMHTNLGRFLKRAMDIAGALVALVLLSPLFLITAIAIKLDSPGPLFFSQKRVGTGGREFDFYKFRSMRTDAEKIKKELMSMNESADGVIFKMKNDPRVTRVGKFIRKYSIDELPQFYNVLRGDMSLVGPRPPVPREVAEYGIEAWRRLEIIPGLTCIWQVSGRSSIGFRDQVKLDAQYIVNQDILYDVRLCLKTIPAVIKGEGAF